MWRKGLLAAWGLVALLGMAGCRPLPPRVYRGPVPAPAMAPPWFVPPGGMMMPPYRVIPGQIHHHEAVVTAEAPSGVPPHETAPAPERPTPSQDQSQAPRAVFYCPMHPAVESDSPGKCTSCGMDLFLRTE